MTEFRVGDMVRVRSGADHPEWGFDMSDWHGRVGKRIDEPEAFAPSFLVYWDSLTLQQIPDEKLLYMIDMGIAWKQGILPGTQLRPAEPRHEPGDRVAVAEARRQELLADDPFYAGATDVAIGEGTEPPEALFDVARFCQVLRIPDTERAAVRRALALGAGHYFHDHYGNYRYGKRPYFALPSLFTYTFPFGYGVLATLDEEKISRSTRQAIVHFALQAIDPFARDAIPYGVVEILSFLAASDALEPDLLRSVFVALELAGTEGRFDGWELASARALSDWLLTHPQIPEAEKVWWLWHFSLQLKDYYHLGQDLIAYWLEHPDLPPARQRQLSRAWLYNGGPVGRPPANWRLMQATFAGDTEAVEAITAEMEIESALDVGEEELMAEMAKAPHLPPMPDPHQTAGGNPVDFFNMLTGMRFGISYGVPAYIRRLVILLVAEMADEPVVVLWDVLDMDEDVDREQLQRGVAQTLQMFGDQIPEAERRELVEAGIEVGLARARREFYALGAAWFGPEYMQRAAKDKAASVRDWAIEAL